MLQSAGLLFFAFAGYARIATLAEEVRDPGSIPRRCWWRSASPSRSTSASAVALAARARPRRLAAPRRRSPTARRARRRRLGGPGRAGRRSGRGLGALLALLAGVGRTTLAMARERRPAAAPRLGRRPRHQVPDRAQVAVGAAVVVLVLVVDLRGAIGFSSFGVLSTTRSPTSRRCARPRRAAPLAAGAARARAGRLPRARRHPAPGRGGRRARGARRRHGRTCRGAAPAHDHLTVPAGRPRCAPLSLSAGTSGPAR